MWCMMYEWLILPLYVVYEQMANWYHSVCGVWCMGTVLSLDVGAGRECRSPAPSLAASVNQHVCAAVCVGDRVPEVTHNTRYLQQDRIDIGVIAHTGRLKWFCWLAYIPARSLWYCKWVTDISTSAVRLSAFFCSMYVIEVMMGWNKKNSLSWNIYHPIMWATASPRPAVSLSAIILYFSMDSILGT